MARKQLTRGQKRDIIWAQGGVCPVCGAPINLARGDVIEIDHGLPLALGGADALPNMQALHAACHREKTKGDITTIAKVKRVARKHAGEHRPRHPFPTNKVWKRVPGGKVVRRDPTRETPS